MRAAPLWVQGFISLRVSIALRARHTILAFSLPSCQISPGTYGEVLDGLCEDAPCAAEWPLSGESADGTATCQPASNS